MINKDTQTQRSSTYFFLLTQYKALKVLFQQRRKWTSIFFFHCLDSKKRTFRARPVKIINNNFFNVFNQDAGFFLAVWFIPQIPKPTSDWEWHKTSRSRVHPVKTRLIILHVPTFFMGFSKKCLRSGPLNWQIQVVRAEGKTRFGKFELFQNSCCHFSQF